ncbi:SDR family NAD(P)-dependent oxidoreductase [Granulicella sp. S190]|uniref:SDR family NAD(P)-dependent oxidoreductase n=1 Tax=Granulicella sp. S190 TaxID=1747226 RepID=UPI00131BE73A|nr:SDR family oxidoreductase [Granulicella sp. S190]
MLNIGSSGVTLSLAGKVALITGGSRGIGAATVRMFRQAGAKVVFNYRSASEQADAIVAECGGGDLCLAVQQPLSTPEDGEALVAAAVAAFGRIDCAILNHGIWPAHDAPIAEMTSEQWRTTMGTNLDSVFGVIRAAVGRMKSQVQIGAERGHIVLVSSTAGQRGEAFHADYAATKGALISLTKSLSTELIGQGIYCNCVAPGWVATDATVGVLSDPEVSKRLLSLIPLGRPAHVDEIAAPILFLCTPFAGFISGEIFNVNGGAVLAG